MFPCPYCRRPISSAPDLAGQIVACPHCAGQIQMPGLPAVVQPSHPANQGGLSMPDHQGPVNILVTSPKREARLHSGGWFSRSLSSAGGVLIALFVFILCCSGLVYGGFQYTLWRTRTTIQETFHGSEKEQEVALKMGRQQLSRFGYSSMSRDSVVTTITLDEEASHRIDGHCKSAAGTHEFVLYMDRRDFGETVEWKFIRLVVDGETIADQSQFKKRMDKLLD